MLPRRIRNVQKPDLTQIYEIYRPSVESGVASFEIAMPDSLDFETKHLKIASKFPYFVMTEGEEILGYCYANTHREREAYNWVVETSIYVKSSKHGSGVGTLLYRQVLTALQQQGFTYALAGITLPNEASLALHKKVGFSELVIYPNVGNKFGNWYDVQWLKFDLNTALANPKPPIFLNPYIDLEII